MPLNSFGAILVFAESLEQKDASFYRAWAGCLQGDAPAGFLENLARESDKNIQEIQRIRRENVTEMILEPIRDFSRTPYEITTCTPDALNGVRLAQEARALEIRARDFYQHAAEKLRALPEVARELKRLGKKRNERLSKLSEQPL